MAIINSNVIQFFNILLDPQCCEDVWSTTPLALDLTSDESVDQYVYKPGTQVGGRVRIVAVEPFMHSGIYMQVLGQLFIGFNPSDDEEDGTTSHITMLAQESTKQHTFKEDYCVLSKILLLGDEERNYLSPGDHQIPFSFTIPTNLPSTIDGSLGFIDYWIEASVRDLTLGAQTKVQRPIVLHDVYDLSAEVSALCPFEVSKEETYCCLCCQSGVFGYEMSLPRKGWTPGEPIKPRIELRNYTPNEVVATLELVKTIKYKVPPHELSHGKVVLSRIVRNVDTDTTEHWNPELDLPAASPPSKINFCDNISFDYILTFKLDAKGCNCDQIEEQITLSVGHIPLSFTPQASIPVILPNQTYVYPSVNLSSDTRPPEQTPLIEQTFYTPGAQPTAPPSIMHQPSRGPALNDPLAAPPSYSECIQMGDSRGGATPSYPLPQRFNPQPDKEKKPL